MAVIHATELWTGRAGGFSADGERDYTRIFRVTTDNKANGPLFVADWIHTNEAALGSEHPDDPLSFLQDIDPRNENFSPTIWLVVLSYSKRKRDPSNPEDDPLEISFTNEKRQIPVQALNSAGDMLDPPVMRDSNLKVANVRLTLGTNIPSWVLAYEDAVNTDSYTIGGLAVGPYQSKCSPIDIGLQDERAGQALRIMDFQIQISRDDMRLSALDAGFRERDGANLVNITNDDGTPITVPALLNGSGAKISDPTPVNAVYLTIGESEGGYVELPFKGNLPGCV